MPASSLVQHDAEYLRKVWLCNARLTTIGYTNPPFTTMIKLGVLIDLFFKPLPLPERIIEIKNCGYDAIETWQGTDPSMVAAIGTACTAADVSFTSVVINSPNDASVAPATAANCSAFLERVDRCSDTALAAGCRNGIVTSGNQDSTAGVSRQQQLDTLAEALTKAGELTRKKGFQLNIEPLNTLVDHAGQLLDCRHDALAILKAVNLPSVRMLYDFYHMQIMGGNHIAFLKQNGEWIGHFHLAGVPGRNEPTGGELDSRFLLAAIPDTTPATHCGLEYKPSGDHAQSLKDCRSLA